MGLSMNTENVKDICPEGVFNLSEAILKICKKDYIRALRALRKNPKNYNALKDVAQIEAFFHSEMFGAMCSVDPEWAIAELKKEAYK